MNGREQEIQKALASLPENIQQAVRNFNWADEILIISNLYGVQIDDVEIFREETMLVVVGLELADHYKKKPYEPYGYLS